MRVKCSVCNKKFDKKGIVNHERMHKKDQDYEDLVRRKQDEDDSISIKHAFESYKSNESLTCGEDYKVSAKAIAKGEQTFTLRAQDKSSAKVIVFWIMENIETAPIEKLRHAFEDAIRMRRWPNRKNAD